MGRSSGRFVSHLRIENYIGLITDIALKHWRRLPKSTKVWVSDEDFINEGMIYTRFKILPYFDVRKGAFTTILQICLDQYFMRKVEAYHSQKRTQVELPIPKSAKAFDTVMNHASVVQMYWQASPLLRAYMYDWFFSGEGIDRLRMSMPFKKARREFLKLAPKFGVTFDVCAGMFDRRESVFVDNERVFEEDERNIR